MGGIDGTLFPLNANTTRFHASLIDKGTGRV